ncbi:hypothetical protein B0H21DRAFT_825279 [Amylocystis lapponica]|nr:hypothetical protein B0H21DRAFT_825279 [Amylocystis lapponica]
MGCEVVKSLVDGGGVLAGSCELEFTAGMIDEYTGPDMDTELGAEEYRDGVGTVSEEKPDSFGVTETGVDADRDAEDEELQMKLAVEPGLELMLEDKDALRFALELMVPLLALRDEEELGAALRVELPAPLVIELVFKDKLDPQLDDVLALPTGWENELLLEPDPAVWKLALELLELKLVEDATDDHTDKLDAEALDAEELAEIELGADEDSPDKLPEVKEGEAEDDTDIDSEVGNTENDEIDGSGNMEDSDGIDKEG